MNMPIWKRRACSKLSSQRTRATAKTLQPRLWKQVPQGGKAPSLPNLSQTQLMMMWKFMKLMSTEPLVNREQTGLTLSTGKQLAQESMCSKEKSLLKNNQPLRWDKRRRRHLCSHLTKWLRSKLEQSWEPRKRPRKRSTKQTKLRSFIRRDLKNSSTRFWKSMPITTLLWRLRIEEQVKEHL